MNDRVRVLRLLVRRSLYVIDEYAIADAILIRLTGPARGLGAGALD